MDFQIPDDFMEATDPKPVAGGQYDLIVVNVELGESKSSGAWQADIEIEIQGQNALPIHKYLQAPGQEGLKNPDWTLREFKRFCLAFDIPVTPGASFNDIISGIQGAVASLPLDIEVDETGKYGDKNGIVFPKI